MRWDRLDKSAAGLSPLDRLRAEYRTVFKCTFASLNFIASAPSSIPHMVVPGDRWMAVPSAPISSATAVAT